ncbi:hypothetical protein IV203_027921 [Nitzschia inconspicua]|uniref:Uncharacterized protein n=1 Tax=Nitzschia inconspicua TaxID=303405 RepID=A0A9K3LXA6_9STRA|nr:hypothetical protein IV203_027921 [Nitzschia inconspicua]
MVDNSREMEEQRSFLHPFPVDDASTILTSSTRSTLTRGDRSLSSAISYDSLTYSMASDENSRINHPSSSALTTSSSGVSLLSHGSSSTLLSSEQLIQNLRRQQQLQQQQQQQPSTGHLRHPGLQSYSGFPSSYHHSDPHDTPYNVYRPRSAIGGLLHQNYCNYPTDDADHGTVVSSQRRNNNQYHTYPQELLLPPSHTRNLRSCLTSPRVLFTVAICGIVFVNLLLGNTHRLEEWWEMGIHGMSAQRTAHSAQAKLLPSIPKVNLKPLHLPTTADYKSDTNLSSSSSSSTENKANGAAISGCEATIMLIRHCEKGSLKSHCSFMGYERSAYLSILFGDDKRWPAPSQIYALNKGRTHKLNYREVETVQGISDAVGVPINRDYSTLDTKALSHVLLDQLLEGELCGKLVLISWKHSDIPKLAQHLGCGPLQGCPWDYKGKDFDSTWQIRYAFTDFYDSKTGQSKKKWNIFGSVQPENFDPLAFSHSAGDYPPGGATQNTLAQWGQDGNFVFYG